MKLPSHPAAFLRPTFLVLMIAAGGFSRAAESSQVPSDDSSILCNHYLPDRAAFPDVRCKDAIAPGDMLLFSRGASPTIELPVQNDRPAAIPAEYTLRLIDRQEQTRSMETGGILLPGEGAAPIKYPLSTSGLPYGVYSLVLEVTANGASLTSREYYVGIISDAVIPKAADGDYLYGLDPNWGGVIARSTAEPGNGRKPGQGQRDLLGWVDASGADILRCAGFGLGPGAWAGNFRDLSIMEEHGLRIMGMAWPPSPGNPAAAKHGDAFSVEKLDAWTQQVENLARQAPSVVYWEVGNEPDLGYPGIAAYTTIYEATYKALKRGNPNAVVMNGGITFFGANGPKNSRRFLELVKPECIDAIAFHAHGPGSPAEQKIYEQASQTAREFGKGDKPLIDTESGMFVGSKKQEDVQAATVVEKQVYAQAVGLKLLMTFRLHAFRHGDLGYGMLRSDQEPMPAFLAYRTMTEHLKGLAFQRKLEMTQAHAEGYSFAERQGSRRACLFWADRPAFYNAYAKIAGASSQVRNPRLMDLYGNTSPVKVSEDGVVRVEVTETPVYLLWDALDPSFEASMARSMLEVPDMVTIVPGAGNSLAVGIRNTSDKELAATLVANISAHGPSSITPSRQAITVPARTTLPLRLLAHWKSAGPDCTWPRSWRVFTGMPETTVDLAAVREEPVRLGGIEGRPVNPVNGQVNLLPPGEAPHERQVGFVFGTLQSDHDQVVKIACNADWWMDLRLNGQLICSTMEKGNEGKVLTERVLELPLKKGANLLAIKVLSGKGGWSVTFASPAELPGLLDPRKAGNFIDLTLEAGHQEVARERLALQPVWRVPWLDGSKWAGEWWRNTKPDFVLEGANVTNLFDKLPDSSKFWQGERDLSAQGWIRCDEQHLYLLVRVLDDKDIVSTEAAKLADSDSLQIGIAREGTSAPDLYCIGRVGGTAVVSREASAQAPRTVTAQIASAKGETLYRIALDRRLVGREAFRLNVLVNDNDDGYRKQFMAWAGGLGLSLDSSLWQDCILTEPGAEGRQP